MNHPQVKRAIDTHLSCLRVTERDAQTIMNRVREGKKVKKKLSVAFVLTLVFSLLAVTALAITLLAGSVFLDRAYGSPASCTVLEDTLYFMTNQGLFSWLPSQEKPVLLMGQQPLASRGISIDALLFHTEELMLLDQSSRKIWAFGGGHPRLALDYAKTELGAVDMRFKSPVYQDGFLFLRAYGQDGQQETVLYRVNLEDGSAEALEIQGVLEWAPYKEGKLLAIQRTHDRRDVVISIETKNGTVQEELASLPLLGIEGISYSPGSDTLCAVVGGALSLWQDGRWQAVRHRSLPQRSFFFSAIGDGYVAVGFDGVQFLSFREEESGMRLSIRGFTPLNNLDHAYELAHPGFSITRQRAAHFCTREVRDAIRAGDDTDLFLIRLDAEALEMMKEGLLEPLSSSGLLTEDGAGMTPVVAKALFAGDTLYAVPSDLLALAWMMKSEGTGAPPTTLLDLLRQHTAWDAGAAAQEGLLYLASDYAIYAWTKEDYGAYLLRQYILEQAVKGEAVDFSSEAFLAALSAIRDASLPAREGQGSLLAAYASGFLRGLREDEPKKEPLPPPAVTAGSPPRIPAYLYAYVLNPNSRHKEAAIAYLEYVAAHRTGETQALLSPERAEPTLYPFVTQWAQEMAQKQRGFDAENGVRTNEEELAARIDALKAHPDSWEVAEDGLNAYRMQIVPYLDLMLHPLLADQSGWHDPTYQEMSSAMGQCLAGELTLEQCAERLNALSRPGPGGT